MAHTQIEEGKKWRVQPFRVTVRPDELMKKIAQNAAQPVFFCQKLMHFITLGMRSKIMWSTSVIKKLYKANNQPLGKK
jgi:hypothetical protein